MTTEPTHSFSAKVYLPEDGQVRSFANSKLEVFSGIEDYWLKRQGVLFFPFDRERDAFFISNEPVDGEGAKPPLLVRNDRLDEQEYKTTILLAKHAMAEGEFSKVVLARNTLLPEAGTAEVHFERAVEINPDAFGFMVDLGVEQWIGASPELLLRYRDGILETAALAGTRMQGEAFGSKEKEEQRMVEEFIEERLQAIGLRNYEKSPKREVNYDQLKHLRTDYRIACAPEEAMHAVLELHPTSAVCGLPRDASYAFIQELETMDRGFYSGMTGLMEENAVTFFVNLRCLRIQNGRTELFAGAGITPHSDADSEWDETQRKIQSIQRLLD